MELLEDKRLLLRLKQGDERAFELLYHRYKGLLYVHAYKRLHNREEVRDIIHEIFLSLWEKRETLVITGSLPAWLYQAVRYKIIDTIAREQHARQYLDTFQQFLNTGGNTADHLAREKILTSIIDKEIDSLPPKMRQVFELSRKANLSHKQIARMLDLSEQSVRSHIKNALRVLRPKLGLYPLLAFQLFF